MTNETGRPQAYRPCVGIMLINNEGKVFLGERIDNPGSWQMPQGGIDQDEEIETTAFRELQEEVGTSKAEIIKIHSRKLKYSLPEKILKETNLWDGKYVGQEQTWIAMRFTGKDEDINLNSYDPPEFLSWKWVDINQIIDLAVSYKREIYFEVIEEFRTLIKTTA